MFSKSRLPSSSGDSSPRPKHFDNQSHFQLTLFLPLMLSVWQEKQEALKGQILCTYSKSATYNMT